MYQRDGIRSGDLGVISRETAPDTDAVRSRRAQLRRSMRALRPRRRRILVAEDDQEMRALLAESLRRAGYHVTVCVDGWDLLRHLESYFVSEQHDPVDLVISDVRMPGLTGLEILRGTRGTEGFPPIILITAFGDDQTHAEATLHRGAAMLDKPFDMEEMLAIVASTIAEAL